jgi:nicotinamidase-related amidase
VNRKYGNGLAGTECRQLISTRYSPLTRRADNRAVSGPLFDVPALLELLPELPKLRPPATVINKTRYSVEPELLSQLQAREADGLIVIGSETDVCVLATVLGAVDLGYRVILVRDAVCSSSDEGHDALMQIYHRRYTEQIEVADASAIVAIPP